MFAKNLAANYLGTVWLTVAQLAILPVYVAYLGVEPYGLIGVHATLTILASLSDLGITPAFSREISRLSGSKAGEAEVRSFFGSLEITYWVFSAIIGVATVTLLPGYVVDWVNAKTIPHNELIIATQLMFAQIALQLVVGFYTGGLLGLQQHVMLNAITIIATTIRFVGAAIVLAFVSPTLTALFAWLIVATALQVIAMALASRRVLPSGEMRFDPQHISRIWKYAGGVTAVMILSLLLTQIDKVILSRTLSLAEFGLYSLATTIAMSLCRPIGPLSRTLLPRMNQLVARGEHDEIARIYHQGSQLASFLVMPVTAVVVLFAPEIMAIGFNGSSEAKSAASLVAVLAIGYAGNALLSIPYTLTLSYGWLRFGLYNNIVACFVMVPLTLVLVQQYGAMGGAMAWAILTSGYVLLSLYYLHSNLLPNEYYAWYVKDTLPPAATAAATAYAFRLIMPQQSHGLVVDTLIIGLIFMIVTAATALSLPVIRNAASKMLSKSFKA